MKKAVLTLTIVLAVTSTFAQLSRLKKPKIDLPITKETPSEPENEPESKPEPVQDYGMTSDAHAKYAGKIVFSAQPIQFKSEDESQFSSNFIYPDQNPFFMAYFPKSIANRCLEEHGALPDIANAYLTVSYYVNGNPSGLVQQALSVSQLNEWTGWSEPETPLGTDKFTRSQYIHLYNDSVITKLIQR